jgi:hypothetical protein
MTSNHPNVQYAHHTFVVFTLKLFNMYNDIENIKSNKCCYKLNRQVLKRFLKIPQFSVKNLSDVLPPQASLTKQMVPCGVIPIKTLIVLWCL